MRKGDNREEKNGGGTGKKIIIRKIVATNVVAKRPPNADRLQRQPLVRKIVKLYRRKTTKNEKLNEIK